MSLKNFNDTIGNRTRDLPVCSVVSEEFADPNFKSNPKRSIFSETSAASYQGGVT